MVSGQSHHTFRKSGTINYPTKLARVICHSLDAEKLPNDPRSRSCFRLFSSKEGQFDVDKVILTNRLKTFSINCIVMLYM